MRQLDYRTYGSYGDFKIRAPKGQGVKYRPGLCTECFRPKEICWETGEKPDDEAKPSNGENNER
jgi:hypothetical protein